MTKIDQKGAAAAWQFVCELGDRTSPEEYPDMALLTQSELGVAIETYLSATATTPAGDDDLVGKLRKWTGIPACLEAASRIQSLTASNEALERERDALDHDVKSAGALRLRAEGHRLSAVSARENFHTMQGAAAELLAKLQAAQAEIARMREALEHWRDTAHEQNGLAMGHEEALQAAQEEITKLKEAAALSAMYLKTGFIECGRCGNEVETKNTDAEYTLREALSTPQEPK